MEHSTTDVSPQTAANPSPSRNSGRRGWWQFSLFSLLLLFVIACLIAGYIGQMRRMEEARRAIAQRDDTIKRLRQELGIDEDAESALSIGDPTKLHVAALPSFEENEWRWKVYLPPGKTWQVGGEVLESEGGGKPLHSVGGNASQIRDEGELVLHAKIHRPIDGLARVTTRISRHVSGYGSNYVASQLNAKGSVSIKQSGRPQQVIAEPGQRLEIFRRTVMEEPQPVPGKNISVAHEKGAIVIYLYEAPPRGSGGPGPRAAK